MATTLSIDPARQLTLEPIGYVRSALATKVEAARQPRASGGAPGRIELQPGRNFEHALCDLAEWQYIWVLFWFDRNDGWRPKVLPPRSRSGRKGVFATRSPHRPNPLGLSAVRLERVDGLTLHVRDVDMLDGTPVLDIKPYVAYTDAIAEAGGGWLTNADAPRDPIPEFEVLWDATAAEQAAVGRSADGLAAARARDGDARARSRAASVSADSPRGRAVSRCASRTGASRSASTSGACTSRRSSPACAKSSSRTVTERARSSTLHRAYYAHWP